MASLVGTLLSRLMPIHQPSWLVRSPMIAAIIEGVAAKYESSVGTRTRVPSDKLENLC